MKNNIFETMQKDILNAKINEVERDKLMKNMLKLRENKINLLITGATGSGKSSTINALFDTEVAKVGIGVDPETMSIRKFELDNLILWDSPGLGDGKEADNKHAKNIIEKLNEVDEDGHALIDLVLVVLDGSTRDLGTSYELINQIIIPNLGKEREDRILIAINQADVAMKGRNWDYHNNKPLQALVDFLNDKVDSVKRRIQEGTGVLVDPIYYSAGYKEEGELQTKPYNLSKLLYYIIKSTPTKKRLAYVANINTDSQMWEEDDELIDYGLEIQNSFIETVKECAETGGNIGKEIGSLFGKTGEFIGETVGKIGGGIVGVLKAGLKSVFSW